MHDAADHISPGEIRTFDPGRLTQARLLRGLKKVDLARDVGKTPAAIGQYEQGTARPSPATLTTIGLVLGFPIAFFALRPKSSFAETNAYFRRLRSVSVHARSTQAARLALLDEVIAYLEQHVELPRLDIPSRPADPASAPERIAEIAAEVRRYWQLGDGPLASVIALLESKGCVVVRLSSESEGIDAYTWRASSRPIVVLTRDKADRARSNFDAAHELGHLVLHPEPESGSRLLEEQANEFAAAFLMPATAITEELPGTFDVGRYVELKQRWRVSVQALLYRARELERISEPKYRRAMTTISAWGWRTHEPAAIGSIDEPSMLTDALKLVADELGLTPERVAADLSIPMDVFQSFTAPIRTRLPFVSRNTVAERGD
jgi:Zn-dependent peptidase ImmA (M78 family)/DNA-binding XRE family transcriptional regulator